MLAIRAATREDAQAIAEVHVASWRSAYQGLLPSALLASLDVDKRALAWRQILADRSGAAYVACEGPEQMLGFIHVCGSRDQDRSSAVGEITSIYLRSEAWGKGIGTKLLERGLDHLGNAGFHDVTLWVLDGNDRACRFYERKGFARDAISKVHPPSGLNEVRYRLKLPASVPENAGSMLASLGISPARITEKNLIFQREPEELRVAAIGDDGTEHRLTPVAAAAWRAMSAAALEDGVVLKIVSAFRSIERQAEIVRGKLERGLSLDAILEVSAPPGYSEHHTGRAIDVTTDGVPALEVEFERTAAFRWLTANGARFGFFLSYPEGNAQGYAYEPWHWCYKP